ncbi:MAG: hypothetical protein KAH10_06830 [Flavobacteriales bacterium]|nr:hypothetical protein [Flavobacteriales bacterium]
MRNLFKTIILSFILSLSYTTVFGQIDVDSISKIENSVIKMIDGDKYVGQIIRRDSTSILLKTSNADMIIPTSSIKNIKRYDYFGKYKFPNLHDTRYFFAPSAIPIKKGSGYYQNIEVVLNFVNYGVTNYFSIGGGFEFITLFSGEVPIIFLTPKVGFKISEKFHAGAGVLFGTKFANGSMGLPYLITTFGSSESNISIGGGVSISGETFGLPVILFSGTARVSNYIALLTENYILVDNDNPYYIGIQGIRVISKENAFDIGLMVLPEIGFPIPFVGYVRTF